MLHQPPVAEDATIPGRRLSKLTCTNKQLSGPPNPCLGFVVALNEPIYTLS